jgi:hypothetical protein
MTASQSRKLQALIALSRDVSTTNGERSLAAHHAAAMMDAAGMDYLTVFPFGLPE